MTWIRASGGLYFVQGQSIPKPLMVAMDLRGVFTPSQAYVMLSRVEDIKQLVIMERIKEKAFRIDE